MKSCLRPSSPHDLPSLQRLLCEVFKAPSTAPFLSAELMTWKYWTPREDWPEPRSYVLEREGAIVAHVGVWPVTLQLGNSVARGIQMIDWASNRASAGAGLTLVQRLAGTVDFMYSIGGSEATQKVLPAFGFKEYTQQWKAVRPLRPLRQMLTHQYRNWKLMPRLVRNWRWSRLGSAAASEQWTLEAIAPNGIVEYPEVSRFADAGIPRPPSFFHYLQQCPAVNFHLYRASVNGRYESHFLLSEVRGQVRLAGVWLREPSRVRFAAVFGLAQRTAKDLEGAVELVTMGSGEGLERDAARESGFTLLPGPKVYVLDRKGTLASLPKLGFQLADDDAAFIDSGHSSYWS